MVSVCVLLLVASILWIFGTLPWLIVNFFLCSPQPASIACANPSTYTQEALLILTFDALLLAVSIFSILQLRSLARRGR
jgi:hypothetical protein